MTAAHAPLWSSSSLAAATKASAFLSCLNLSTNGSSARSKHSSSSSLFSDARVALFFQAERGMDLRRLAALLAASYQQDPLFTLRFVAFLRDVRGGRKERKLGRLALVWLAQNHPMPLAANLRFYIGEFGRFDDFMWLVGTKAECEALGFVQTQLESDLRNLKQGNQYAISLCAKWVPRESKCVLSQQSKHHLVSVNRALANHMGLRSAELRKKFLAPLRNAMNLIETSMCESRVQEIFFDDMPAKAMLFHGRPSGSFASNAPTAFANWKSTFDGEGTAISKPIRLRRRIFPVQRRANGLIKPKTSDEQVLEPAEIVGEYLFHPTRKQDAWIESRWNQFMRSAKQWQPQGFVRNAMVLVSSPLVMEDGALVACALLLAELEQHSIGRRIMTLDGGGGGGEVRFVDVTASSLHDRVAQLRSLKIGGGCDLNGPMREVLQFAVANNLSPDQMPQRLVVLSDISPNDMTMPSRALVQRFEQFGMEVPHVLVWNVRGGAGGSRNTIEVPKPQADRSYLQWFTMHILKMMLQQRTIEPAALVQTIVMSPRYECITDGVTGSS